VADVYDAIAALAAGHDFRGDESAAATVAAYLDENAPEPAESDGYDAMTREDLARELGERGEVVARGARKAELVERLRELDAAADEG